MTVQKTKNRQVLGDPLGFISNLLGGNVQESTPPLAGPVIGDPVKFAPALSGKTMTKSFEGFRAKPYVDTVGKNTVGYGFNTDDPFIQGQMPESYDPEVGLGKKESNAIFDKIYSNAVQDAIKFVGPDTFMQLDEGQQNVIIDMAYNMGSKSLGSFKKLQTALQDMDFEQASKEIKKSKYYKQTGRRAKNHVLQILGQ